MKTSWKDIIIGVLVAYVVVDVLFATMGSRKYPMLMEEISKSINNTDGLLVLSIGIVIGVVAWYLSSQVNTEYFKNELKK